MATWWLDWVWVWVCEIVIQFTMIRTGWHKVHVGFHFFSGFFVAPDLFFFT